MNKLPHLRSILAILLWILLYSTTLSAQELNCRINVNTDQIGGTDKAVYESFRTAVTEFMNSRQWSSAPISQNEKIDCSFSFIFKETEGSQHTVEMQIQSRRPVYGSSYTTTVLNVRQSVEFNYSENEYLEFNAINPDNNLTAILAFWSYVILAMDFDSFSLYGGESFIQQAQNLVTLAQGILGDNWSAHSDSRNCWAWCDALTDENQKTLRAFNYQYHRQGMDVLAEQVDAGRQHITELFPVLDEVKKHDPSSPLLANLADAKLDEWIQLYSKAPMSEKEKAYNLLNAVWPGQSNRLGAILDNQ